MFQYVHQLCLPIFSFFTENTHLLWLHMKHESKVKTLKLYEAEANSRFDKCLFISTGMPFYIVVRSAIVTINQKFYTRNNLVTFISKKSPCLVYHMNLLGALSANVI